MICRECGRIIEDTAEECTYCGCVFTESDTFIWSELMPVPVFCKNSGSDEEESDADSGILSRRAKKIMWQAAAVLVEVLILACVISGIYMWKQKNAPPPLPDAENIVYSSDDIVMMLVKQKDKWIIEKPDEGYNSCCFLDLDFDGSPELISIAYDRENSVTGLRAFNVRNCTLDEIPAAQQSGDGFFDIGQYMNLYYSPDTKEMLYISSDTRKGDSGSTSLLGSFYMYEKQLYQRVYFREDFIDGIYSYEYYDEEQQTVSVTKQEYITQQKAFGSKLADLRLQYEWVQSSGDMSELSQSKLAALLLRSYDSFFYDTSGLALQ